MSYFAFAMQPTGAMLPVSGDPAGLYPESPFHTVGGNFSGIVIPIATSVNLHGSVYYSGGTYDHVFLNIYDLFPAIVTHDTVLEIGPIPLDGPDFLIRDVPSGPKLVQAFVDKNENGEFDTCETNAYLQNSFEGIVLAGGGFDEELIIYLYEEGFGENFTTPSELAMELSPNPVNGAVEIEVRLGKPAELDLRIFDTNGKLISTVASGTMQSGVHILTWVGSSQDGSPAPSGIYLIRLDLAERALTKKIVMIR